MGSVKRKLAVCSKTCWLTGVIEMLPISWLRSDLQIQLLVCTNLIFSLVTGR